MFSDFIVRDAVFLYNAFPIVAVIILALFVLNEIRKLMVARRKLAVQVRRLEQKNAAFNPFNTL